MSGASSSINLTDVSAGTFNVRRLITGGSGNITLTKHNGDIYIAPRAGYTVGLDRVETTGTVSFSATQANARISTASDATIAGGALNLTADKIDHQGAITATGTVAISATSNNVNMRLGVTGDATANAIELSAAEITAISAAKLQLGVLAGGNVTVESNINVAAPVLAVSLSNGTFTGGGAITVGSLGVSAGTGINLTGANMIDTFAAITNTFGGGAVQVKLNNNKSLTVGQVAGVWDGIISDGVSLAVNGTLTVNHPINGTLGMPITLKANDLVLANTPNLIGDTTFVPGQVGIGTYNGSGAIFVGEASGSGLNVSNTELQRINGNTLTIGDSGQTGNKIGRAHV